LRLGVDAKIESQGFTPHLTLARFADKPDLSLTQFVSKHASYCSARWTVASFQLYRSTLHSSGAVHDVVGTYALTEVCRDR
jgi:2'-5' RNA ligase